VEFYTEAVSITIGICSTFLLNGNSKYENRENQDSWGVKSSERPENGTGYCNDEYGRKSKNRWW